MTVDNEAATVTSSDGQEAENGATPVYTASEPRVQRRLAEISFNARVSQMVYEVTEMMFGLKPMMAGGAPDEEAANLGIDETPLRRDAWWGCCKCARMWKAPTTNGLCPHCGTADVELLIGSPEGKR